MLTEKSYHEIREALEQSERPLFFFDDDPDGLCSFLLLYRCKKAGKGVIVKSTPELKPLFVRAVESYNPDRVFILDKPLVSPEFISSVHQPLVWIDHHDPVEITGTAYYNSKSNGFGEPVSCICYRVVKQDLWIAMAGAVGDWHLPDFAKEFSQQHPELLPAGIKKPEKALYETKLGELVRILSFILKGKSADILSCIKIMTRISGPHEILAGETTQARFIMKRFAKIKKEYDTLLTKALAQDMKGNLMVFTYTHRNTSFTSDLSNELLYRFPGKVILIAREKGGEMKCSIRSSDAISVASLLKNALAGIEGYGGGHEHACGACIKNPDFTRFVEQLRHELEERAVVKK